MLKTHQKQIVSSKTMRTMLDGVKENLRKSLKRQKDEMGFNLAALKITGERVKDMGTKDYVDEETWEEDDGSSKKKRGFVQVS